MASNHIKEYADCAIIEFALGLDYFPIIWASDAAEKLFGTDETRTIGTNINTFFNEYDFNAFLRNIRNQPLKKSFCIPVRFIKPDRSEHTVTLKATRFFCENGEERVVATITDCATDNRFLSEIFRLQQLACTDRMTELLNRHTIKQQIDEYLKYNKEELCCAILIDIDDFKKINDTYGHPFGDSVIFDVSRALCSSFRKTDLVARMGGDEFLVFMKNASVDLGIQKANELCSLFRGYLSDKENFKLSTSIGVACCKGKNFDELYKRSDNALYRSKRKGKNQVTLDMDNASVLAVV